MNLKNATAALMIALAYELLLKLGHILAPSLFVLPLVPMITSLLSLSVFAVIIVFMVLFYREQRNNRQIGTALWLLVGCVLVQFLLRVFLRASMSAFTTLRLAEGVMGVAQAVLLLVLVMFYRKEIPAHNVSLRKASTILAVMLGIGVLKSLASLAGFVQFAYSGAELNLPAMIDPIMVILFVAGHLSMIVFLYYYYRLKCSAEAGPVAAGIFER